MLQDDVKDLLNSSLALGLMSSDIPARMAYTGTDCAPRVVPVGFHWTESRVVVCPLPTAYKVRALHADPRVALTIDTTGRQPPHVLLIRGTASIEIVDGVPSEYVKASRKAIDDAQWAVFEAEVRSLYKQMARITITPQWRNCSTSKRRCRATWSGLYANTSKSRSRERPTGNSHDVATQHRPWSDLWSAPNVCRGS